MSGINFRPPPAVNQSQTANRAPPIIGAQNNAAKHAIAYDPRYSKSCALALLLKLKRGLSFFKSGSKWHTANARQKRGLIFEP